MLADEIQKKKKNNKTKRSKTKTFLANNDCYFVTRLLEIELIRVNNTFNIKIDFSC